MVAPCMRRTIWGTSLTKLESWGVETTPIRGWHLIPEKHLASTSPALSASEFAIARPQTGYSAAELSASVTAQQSAAQDTTARRRRRRPSCPGELAVPSYLVSQETLEFMGFLPRVAERIMSRYWWSLRSPENQGAQHRCSDHFFQNACMQPLKDLAKEDNVVGVETDYAPVLAGLGFTPQAIARITHPDLVPWKDKFSVEAMAYMAIESSWVFLCSFNEILQPTGFLPDPDSTTETSSTVRPETSAANEQGSGQANPGNQTLPDGSASGRNNPRYEQLLRPSGPLFTSLVDAEYSQWYNGFEVMFKGGLAGNVPDYTGMSMNALHMYGFDKGKDPSKYMDTDDHDKVFNPGCVAGGPRAGLKSYMTRHKTELAPYDYGLYLTPQLGTALAYCAMRAKCRGDDRRMVHTAVMAIAVPCHKTPPPANLSDLGWQTFAKIAYTQCGDETSLDRCHQFLSALDDDDWVEAPICSVGKRRFLASVRGEMPDMPVTCLLLQTGAEALQTFVSDTAIDKLEQDSINKIWITDLTME